MIDGSGRLRDWLRAGIPAPSPAGCRLDGALVRDSEGAWPALVKSGSRAAAAASVPAVSRVSTPGPPPPPRRSPRRRRGSPAPSIREMSAPAQSPAEGTEGAAPEGGPPSPHPNLTSNRRLQQTQAQVEEVVDIMRVNVDKVLERDQKLSELDERADALQAGASLFESSAAKLKSKYCWKDFKMMIMLGAICAIVLVVIIIYFFT